MCKIIWWLLQFMLPLHRRNYTKCYPAQLKGTTKIYKNRHIVTTKGQKLFSGTQIGIDKLNEKQYGKRSSNKTNGGLHQWSSNLQAGSVFAK
jgi:hypothetical protein